MCPVDSTRNEKVRSPIERKHWNGKHHTTITLDSLSKHYHRVGQGKIVQRLNLVHDLSIIAKFASWEDILVMVVVAVTQTH